MPKRPETSRAGSNGVERIGWWLGALAPMLMVIGFFAVDEGGTELSGSRTDIVDQLAASQWRIVIGNLIGILGAFALLGFVASLRSHLSTTSSGAWLGSLAVTVALTPTDHGGVSLTLLLWLTAASAGLLIRPAPSRAERRRTLTLVRSGTDHRRRR